MLNPMRSEEVRDKEWSEGLKTVIDEQKQKELEEENGANEDEKPKLLQDEEPEGDELDDVKPYNPDAKPEEKVESMPVDVDYSYDYKYEPFTKEQCPKSRRCRP